MSQEPNADRVARLEVKNEELQAQVEDLRAKLQAVEAEKEHLARDRTRVAGFPTDIASRALLGPGLVGSLRAWLRAKNVRDPFPVDETAVLGAEILRRWLRVGFWHVLLGTGGAFTAGILIWQGFLIRGQIEQQQVQNELIRSQVKQQTSDNLIVRRAQLLDTIYDEVCPPATATSEGTMANSGTEGTKELDQLKKELDHLRSRFNLDLRRPLADLNENCRPRAHVRARGEAVLAFSQIERSRGAAVELQLANLSGLDLRRAVLWKANLSKVNLSGADLRAADLRSAYLEDANLSDAHLLQANFREAVLTGADLSGAYLYGADLSGARLNSANFEGADITRTDLSGADLAGLLNPARGLTQEQLDTAIGDERTRLPEGLKRPAAWMAR